MQPSPQCPATNIYPPFALSALGVGLSLVVAALALPAPVQAQQPMPIRDSVQGLLLLDFAAAPLGQSLNALAQQAGVQILYAGTLTAGKHAPAVQGHYSVAGALRLLLADSGLVASARDARTFIVTQQEDGTVQALDTVTVRGAVSAVTEGSRSYTTGSTRSATKLDLSIRETPQSISVVTRQQMDDQNMRSLTDAVVATPGISLYGSGPRRLGFYARGFSIENVMTDGVPTAYSISLGAGLVADPDLSMYDHVEVVRGATGLMQGAGNPSASINLVRKRPTAERQVRLAIDAGSWDNYRAETDLSGRLNESGSVRGRAVAAYRNSGDFRDYVKHEYSTLYAIGEADLSSDTTLSAGFSWQNNRNDDSWGGLAAADSTGRDLGLSRSTYLGNDWEYWNQKTSGVFADLEHRLDNGWALRMAATATQSTLDYLGTYLYRNETTGGINQSRSGGYVYKVRQHSYDAYASGPFELLGRSHELVAGLSSRRARTNTEGGSGGTVAENIDVENWDWRSIPRPETAITYTADNKREQNSLYLTTRLSLSEPLTMILGGRLDWYDYDDVQKGTGYKVTRNLTKYAGLVYDLDARHSVYASYTDIFQPQGNYDVDGNLLDPVIGKNYEIGVKGEYFGGRLNASAALYRIEQERLAMLLADQAACPTYPTSSCYAASGLVRSQGIDLEVQGALISSLELSAGYTWSDREYRKDANPSRIGQRYATYLPEHQFKLGVLYHLNDRWRVGGSMAWQSRIYEKEGDYDFVQKAYMVMNLMAGWRAAKSLEVQVNVNNLFDKTYYTGIQGSSYPNQVYGAPRNVMLTARYGF
ncbi:TonB-dependent siderophore receptor [Corticimicrobacter populi]|uniref:TonB-dependent siderophore receptor n=1 Tax=Corticimicrobacter populi TaxID=2175229 RepID=A0A2V1K0D0_9BURK|nr:TonB-dependent receptor [Corticimicrobacter populi]PWF22079.1 TonB-dependent siderophore receptor [Corticimicrobacter populi]